MGIYTSHTSNIAILPTSLLPSSLSLLFLFYFLSFLHFSSPVSLLSSFPHIILLPSFLSSHHLPPILYSVPPPPRSPSLSLSPTLLSLLSTVYQQSLDRGVWVGESRGLGSHLCLPTGRGTYCTILTVSYVVIYS
jgi:hypothetical protein